MENINVREGEVEKHASFSYTSKKLKTFAIYNIIAAVAIILMAVAIGLFGFASQKYGLDSMFGEEGTQGALAMIIFAIFGVSIVLVAVGGIGGFFTKRALACVNSNLAAVWSSTKKKLIANTANTVANSILKDGILKDSANAVNSVYQTYQAYKIRKNIIAGINIELERANVPDAKERGKAAFFSMIISTILMLAVALVGTAIIVKNANVEGYPTDLYAAWISYFFAGLLLASLIDVAIFNAYLLKASKDLSLAKE